MLRTVCLLLVLGLAPRAFAGSPETQDLVEIVIEPGSGDLPQGARAKRWQAVWTRAPMRGLFSVRDLAANGGRPVAIHVSEGHDPALPFRAVLYFHGHGGNVGEHFLSSGVLSRLKWLSTVDANTIFVCPEAGAKPFHYWMKGPESFRRLEEVALGEAARLIGTTITIDRRIVSAHSGGGLALRNAVVSGQFAAHRIEFLDCNYGDWGMVIANWAAAQPAGQRPPITTWNTPGPTRTHDAEIKRRHPALVTVNASPVGHHDIPGRLLGAVLLD